MLEMLPSITAENKKALYKHIWQDSKGDFFYYVLVILAAFVSTFGLLMGSTATIIGAMLISPIMSPIIGLSLSITLGMSNLFKKSLKSLLYGTLIAVLVSITLTAVSPVKEMTPEILSRVNPTLIDLFVALASGAAGAFTMCYKKDAAVLPGVAIATALMPPLCVIGIGVVAGEYQVAFGGFMLFLANLIAINLASALIFKLVGFTTSSDINDEVILAKKRMLISISAFILIALPLSYIMYTTIQNERNNKLVENSLRASMAELYNVDLVNHTFKYDNNSYDISAVVRSPQKLSGNNIRQIENALEHKLGKSTTLDVKVILIQEVNATTLPEQSKAEDKPPVLALPDNINGDKIIKYVIDENLALQGTRLEDFSFTYKNQTSAYNIEILAKGDEKKKDQLKKTLENILEEKLNRKVNVDLKYVLDGVSGEVYQPAGQLENLDENLYKLE